MRLKKTLIINILNITGKLSDSDVRSKVIKNGKLKFSKILKCVTDLTEFKALYNSERFYKFMQTPESEAIKKTLLDIIEEKLLKVWAANTNLKLKSVTPKYETI